jgi:hypothetical protein
MLVVEAEADTIVVVEVQVPLVQVVAAQELLTLQHLMVEQTKVVVAVEDIQVELVVLALLSLDTKYIKHYRSLK